MFSSLSTPWSRGFRSFQPHQGFFTQVPCERGTLCSKLKIAWGSQLLGKEQTQVWNLNHRRWCRCCEIKRLLSHRAWLRKASALPGFELQRPLGRFVVGAKRNPLKVWKWDVPHPSGISTSELFSSHCYLLTHWSWCVCCVFVWSPQYIISCMPEFSCDYYFPIIRGLLVCTILNNIMCCCSYGKHQNSDFGRFIYNFIFKSLFIFYFIFKSQVLELFSTPAVTI